MRQTFSGKYLNLIGKAWFFFGAAACGEGIFMYRSISIWIPLCVFVCANVIGWYFYDLFDNVESFECTINEMAKILVIFGPGISFNIFLLGLNYEVMKYTSIVLCIIASYQLLHEHSENVKRKVSK